MTIHRHEDPHRRSLELLSEYLDGSLDSDERGSVEAHLAACAPCREVLEDLRQVADAARALGPIEPPRDLWPGILEGLGGRAGGEGPAAGPMLHRPAEASPSPAAASGRGSARTTKRFSLTAPQLAAAAVLLVTISSAATWWARSPGAPAAPTAEGSARPVEVLPAARPEGVPLDAGAASELARLEALLEASRTRLDPGTVDVLERNLVVIERAIEDSYRALALDPENDFLRGHLERAFERKLEYLRDVSLMVDRAG